MDNEALISVVIPAYNRCASLRRLLDALQAQTYPQDRMEVVVVADGCTDGTVEMLRAYESSFALHVIEQTNQGLAVARNQGAARARGELLVFLDDDLEPTPGLIEAHRRAHARQPGGIVVGPYLPTVQDTPSSLDIEMGNWWTDHFQNMGQPGHRFHYRDLCGGNLSLEKALFVRLGGFDAWFSPFGCHEDWELGARALKAGLPLAFAAEALAHHHLSRDLQAFLDRAFREGWADVRLLRRHPDLLPGLPLAHPEWNDSRLNRWMRALAFARPAAGDRLAALLRRLLGVLEKLGWHSRWRRHLLGLWDYRYWRGVREEVDSRAALQALLDDCWRRAEQAGPEIEIDLKLGLAAAERRLDAERPAGAHLRYGWHVIGHIPATAGAERLRGAHLRPVLATRLARPLFGALAVESITNPNGTLPAFFVRFWEQEA